MKAYAALAALLLAVPAESFARGKVYVTSRPVVVSRVVVPRVVVPRVRYVQPYYYGPSYGTYYGSSYYSGFGTNYYPGYTTGYAPSVSFTYSSTRSTPAYRPAPASYDSGSSLEAGVQRELRRLGYYDGAIDGDIGPASRAAIRDYQSTRGLAATGRIDAALLRSLGM